MDTDRIFKRKIYNRLLKWKDLLSSHECSESESESKGNNKTPSVTLVPHGFDYMVDKVTEDYAEFWQRP